MVEDFRTQYAFFNGHAIDCNYIHSNYCVTHTSSITNRHGGQLLRVNCGRHAETSDSGATQFNIVRFLYAVES